MTGQYTTAINGALADLHRAIDNLVRNKFYQPGQCVNIDSIFDMPVRLCLNGMTVIRLHGIPVQWEFLYYIADTINGALLDLAMEALQEVYQGSIVN